MTTVIRLDTLLGMVNTGQKEANTMTTTTTAVVECAEDALVDAVVEATGLVPAVREAYVAVSDDRGVVRGWAVTVGVPQQHQHTYEIIPPEGDSLGCWMDDGLARLLTADQITGLMGWLTAA